MTYWLDCPYQDGKCAFGNPPPHLGGLPCKPADTTEEERLENSKRCPYLLRYKNDTQNPR